MQEIIKGVNALATEEMIRANKEHPLFRSKHEAIGVILEEVEEVDLEAFAIKKTFERFKEAVFFDEDDLLDLRIESVRKNAVLCACEAIQIVAMCDKFYMSKEEMNE